MHLDELTHRCLKRFELARIHNGCGFERRAKPQIHAELLAYFDLHNLESVGDSSMRCRGGERFQEPDVAISHDLMPAKGCQEFLLGRLGPLAAERC